LLKTTAAAYRSTNQAELPFGIFTVQTGRSARNRSICGAQLVVA
jgi:hypothetical protein